MFALGRSTQVCPRQKTRPMHGGRVCRNLAATQQFGKCMSSSAEAAEHRRRALLAMNWPTSERVGQQLGFPVEVAAQVAATLRATGRMLGVWSSTQHTFVHPTFQFDTEGRLRSDVESLLTALPANGDEGGWRRAFWLYGVREVLAGLCPADVFPGDPAKVLALARAEFGEY